MKPKLLARSRYDRGIKPEDLAFSVREVKAWAPYTLQIRGQWPRRSYGVVELPGPQFAFSEAFVCIGSDIVRCPRDPEVIFVFGVLSRALYGVAFKFAVCSCRFSPQEVLELLISWREKRYDVAEVLMGDSTPD